MIVIDNVKSEVEAQIGGDELVLLFDFVDSVGEVHQGIITSHALAKLSEAMNDAKDGFLFDQMRSLDVITQKTTYPWGAA